MLRYYRGHSAAASQSGRVPETPYSPGIFSVRAPKSGGFPRFADDPCAPSREFFGAEQGAASTFQGLSPAPDPIGIIAKRIGCLTSYRINVANLEIIPQSPVKLRPRARLQEIGGLFRRAAE